MDRQTITLVYLTLIIPTFQQQAPSSR